MGGEKRERDGTSTMQTPMCNLLVCLGMSRERMASCRNAEVKTQHVVSIAEAHATVRQRIKGTERKGR